MFGTYTQQLLIFMNKKEKYIEFIVDQLIEVSTIELDSLGDIFVSAEWTNYVAIYADSLETFFYGDFSEYLESKYGTNYEDLGQILDMLYWRLIQTSV
jgi:hypothetical protein